MILWISLGILVVGYLLFYVGFIKYLKFVPREMYLEKERQIEVLVKVVADLREERKSLQIQSLKITQGIEIDVKELTITFPVDMPVGDVCTHLDFIFRMPELMKYSFPVRMAAYEGGFIMKVTHPWKMRRIGRCFERSFMDAVED